MPGAQEALVKAGEARGEGVVGRGPGLDSCCGVRMEGQGRSLRGELCAVCAMKGSPSWGAGPGGQGSVEQCGG